MAEIVLGVSGSIAAYRAADLAEDLKRAGHAVRVCLTDSAAKFVTPTLFEALTGEPCLVGTFERAETGGLAHIDWARWAKLVLVAPCTANTMNRIAAGLAEDMLSSLLLVYEGRLVVAPAMNPSMYAHEATQAALRVLRDRGAEIVDPAEGDAACGENGQGKLAANSEILERVEAVLSASSALVGRRVLITSGPTREAIDAVRFVSNRSSGKMGAALARAALMMGAEVTVITGPSTAVMPVRANVVRVESAREMLAAGLMVAPEADLVIGAAAVADYRPARAHDGKLPKREERMSLEMVRNPDVLSALAEKCPGAAVGFAAEVAGSREAALEKLRAKGLAAIALNDVGDSEIGFESDRNELTLLDADGKSEGSGRMSKLRCAIWLLERAAKLPGVFR